MSVDIIATIIVAGVAIVGFLWKLLNGIAKVQSNIANVQTNIANVQATIAMYKAMLPSFASVWHGLKG